MDYVPATTVFGRREGRKLNLNTVDAVYAVNEEDKNEDKGNLIQMAQLAVFHVPCPDDFAYLHSILQFRYYRALGDEREELTAPSEWQWDDESHEDDHLGHQQEEDLKEE
jgi:hypothetical protein